MKSFKEILTEAKYKIYNDKNSSNWAEQKAISYGLKNGYKPKAVLGSDFKDFVLFGLDAFDKDYTKSVKLKSDEELYRFGNDNTVIGKMLPLIKVNFKKGMAYHLTEESSSGEIDEPVFQTKGQKFKYVRFIK